MKRVKGQFKIRSVYQGLTVGKLPSPKLAKLLPEILKRSDSLVLPQNIPSNQDLKNQDLKRVLSFPDTNQDFVNNMDFVYRTWSQ